MKKIIFYIVSVLASFCYAQIGIGTNNPSESAMIDLVSSNKGFIGSHIPLKGIRDRVTIENPAEGLMVYNTSTTNNLQPGYYVWIKDKWVSSGEVLNLEVTTNGDLIDYLSYEALGKAPIKLTNFTSNNIKFTNLGCKTWEGNGHSYCAYKTDKSFDWQEAFNAAKSQKGYLPTFTSSDEWKWVLENIIMKKKEKINLATEKLTLIGNGYDLSTSIWIGYNKVNFAGNPTEFTWITGEKSKTNWSTFTTEHYFAKDEPNNEKGIEGCVHVIHRDSEKNRTWNDVPCNYKTGGIGKTWLHFIIEFNN